MYKEDNSVKVFFFGKNFMTPNVVEVGRTNEYLYELSRGDSEIFGRMWGVTILTKDGYKTDKSKVFNSQNEAREYLEGVDNDIEER